MAPDDLVFLKTTWRCWVSGTIKNPSNLSFQMLQPLKRTVVGRSRGGSCAVCLASKALFVVQILHRRRCRALGGFAPLPVYPLKLWRMPAHGEGVVSSIEASMASHRVQVGIQVDPSRPLRRRIHFEKRDAFVKASRLTHLYCLSVYTIQRASPSADNLLLRLIMSSTTSKFGDGRSWLSRSDFFCVRPWGGLRHKSAAGL